MFKISGQPTKEMIEQFDEDDNIFYRFQNPKFDIEGIYEQSWGMIYSTPEEALEDDSTVLGGKSCMQTLDQITNWMQYFDKDDVLLIFNGRDTYEEGHDGEFVAAYYEEVAVWSMEDVKAYLEKESAA